jgi:hypothetical protein
MHRTVDAQAAENATGWYALGTKDSMAGFVPPPGTYLIDVNMFYEGNASAASAVGVALQDISPAARKLNLKGELLIEAKADVTGRVYYNLPSVLWVAPQKVLGGMSASAPSSRSDRRTSISISTRWPL